MPEILNEHADACCLSARGGHRHGDMPRTCSRESINGFSYYLSTTVGCMFRLVGEKTAARFPFKRFIAILCLHQLQVRMKR